MTQPDTRSAPREFPSTRWSVVIAARGAPSDTSAAALETICRSYWYPLYSYVRHSGRSPHDAQDITQGFFCQLLEKGWLDAADRERGRLRSFLITALKHYMTNEWRRESAQRRGGAVTHVPIDGDLAESRFAADASTAQSPDLAFDRQWALTLLELTLNRLHDEYSTAGKSDLFDALKSTLIAERGSLHYSALAANLELTEGAVRVAVHRFRQRFRRLYREEIAQTLPLDADLQAEIRHLTAALAAGP